MWNLKRSKKARPQEWQLPGSHKRKDKMTKRTINKRKNSACPTHGFISGAVFSFVFSSDLFVSLTCSNQLKLLLGVEGNQVRKCCSEQHKDDHTQNKYINFVICHKPLCYGYTATLRGAKRRHIAINCFYFCFLYR